MGMSGKVVSLLSAGIDSPVATWRMIRRGAVAVGVHFSGWPQTNDLSERIVGEMHRVLRPGGRLAVMMYHRRSTRYWISGVVRHGVFGLELLRKTPDEIQMSFTDGFFARHYSRSELRRLFGQFEVTDLRTLDMRDLAIPLRPLRKGLLRLLGPKRYWALVRRVEAAFGWELFLKARKPDLSGH